MRHQLVVFALVVGLAAALPNAAQGQSRPAAPSSRPAASSGASHVTLAVIVQQGPVECPQLLAVEGALLETFSREPGVVLVERAEIHKALREIGRAKSGLLESGLGLDIVQMLRADAICILEAMGGNMAQSMIRHTASRVTNQRYVPEAGGVLIQTRLIETRSGALLGQSVQPAEQAAEGGGPAAMVRQALRKIRIPAAQKHYVSVLEVRSQEVGFQLDALATALAAVIESDLVASPDVVVLDRRQLERLGGERVLSGESVAPRQSATLVQVGLRRKPSGLCADLWISRTGQAAGSPVTVDLPQPTLSGMRAVLGPRLASLLKISHSPAQPRGVESDESDCFWAQAQLRIWQNDLPEAMRLATTAVQLKDTLRARIVLQRARVAVALARREAATAADGGERPIYREIGRDMMVTGFIYPPHVRIDAMCRALQDDLDVAGRYQDKDLLLAGYEYLQIWPAWPDQKVERDLIKHAGPDQARQSLARLRRLFLEQWEVSLAFRKRQRMDEYGHYNVRIRLAPRACDSAEQFQDVIRKGLIPYQSPAGRIYAHPGFGELLTLTLDEAAAKFGRDTLKTLLTELAESQPEMVRFAARTELSCLEGKEGALWAARALDVYFDQLPAGHQANGLPTCMSPPLASHLIEQLLKKGNIEEYFESVLDRYAGDGGSAASEKLVANPDAWQFALAAAHPERARQWAVRIRRKLAADPPQGPAADFALRVRALLNPYGPLLVDTQVIAERLAQSPWRNYTLHEIEMRISGGLQYRGLKWHFLVPAGGDDVVGGISFGQLHIVFQKTLSTPAPGPTRFLGRWHDLQDSPPRMVAASVIGDTAYILTSRDGIFVCRGGQRVDSLNWSKGLPGFNIGSMDSLGGRLYLSVFDRPGREGASSALICYDPATGIFDTKASSRSMRLGNALDGGRRYSIESIWADRKRNCIWLGIEGIDRGGLWRYDPHANTATRLIAIDNDHPDFDPGQLVWFDEDTFICNDGRLLHLESGRITDILGGRDRHVPFRNALFRRDYVHAFAGGGWQRTTKLTYKVGPDLLGLDTIHELGPQPLVLLAFDRRQRVAYPCPFPQLRPQWLVPLASGKGIVTVKPAGVPILQHLYRNDAPTSRPGNSTGATTRPSSQPAR